MNKIYEKLTLVYDEIRERTDFEPKVGLILGSGLGGFADKVKVVKEIPYSDLDGFPVSTVQGHAGKFVFGYVGDVPVVCMKGRVHYYEGYDIKDVVLPVRIMVMLGAKIIMLTNAAGGVNTSFKPGTLMMIKDQISCFAPNPLIGQNIEEFGTRFPDMSNIYNKELCEKLMATAKKDGIDLKKGVYLQLTGPSYETPAEIRMVRTLGGDAVGMSTAVEAIAANHMGAKVCGVSCITNMAAGILNQPLNHKEVQETADMVSKSFEKLVYDFISSL